MFNRKKLKDPVSEATQTYDVYSVASKYKDWSMDDLAAANTVQNADYLNMEEKKVIFLCNLARLNGKLFVKTFLKDQVKKETDKVRSLKAELNALPRLTPLKPLGELHNSSLSHATDLGTHNKTGHNSTNGQAMDDRIWSFVDADVVAENCAFGQKNAIDIVIALLVDEGVDSLGHRHNILNAQFEYIGVSIAPHVGYETTCVQDFAGGLA